jgi:hypothetical protein
MYSILFCNAKIAKLSVPRTIKAMERRCGSDKRHGGLCNRKKEAEIDFLNIKNRETAAYHTREPFLEIQTAYEHFFISVIDS